jgi:hypothetical protein
MAPKISNQLQPSQRHSGQLQEQHLQPTSTGTAGNKRTQRASPESEGDVSPNTDVDPPWKKLKSRELVPLQHQSSHPALDPLNDPIPTETVPQMVEQLVSTHVHVALRRGWTINRSLPMWFLFDVISPAHQFKRGTPFVDGVEFPILDLKHPGDITETDDGPSGWMPYWPGKYRCVCPHPNNCWNTYLHSSSK